MPIDIDRLEWDDWNRDHIAMHAVVLEEVEEVVGSRSPVFRDTYKGRYQILGLTLSGRILSVIVGPVPGENNVWYVFSARPASRKERRWYASMTGGLSDEEV